MAVGTTTIQATNAPHILFSEDNVVAKFNHKKSQWGLFYNLSARNFKKTYTDIDETYVLENKTIHRVQEGLHDQNKHFTHNIDLSYNLTEQDKYVFNVVFRNSIYDAPSLNQSNKLYDAADDDNYIFSGLKNKQSGYTPSLDLYYQRTLPKNQMLTMSVTGTLMHTDNNRLYHEYTPQAEDLAMLETDVTGNKRSIIGEAIYDKRFKSLVFSSGLRHYRMYARNEYAGSSPVVSEMNQAKTAAFAEVQGNIKKVSYGVNCEENMIIRHDSKWTEEAIYNILDNALKYTEPGGKIHIQTERQELFFKISISDTGKGIAPERQAEIFTRFYREPEVHDKPGVGIGLYLARTIMELQKGYIEVQSEVGKGACFRLYLPVIKS